MLFTPSTGASRTSPRTADLSVLLGGDFRQVLPVVPRAPPAVIVDTCLKRSPLWPLFRQHRLTRNIPGEGEFAAWLLQLGNGALNDTSVQQEIIKIPPTCVCEGDLIDEIFSASEHSRLQDRVILSPKNEHCLHINERHCQEKPGCT
jgi:hypothetical protein